MDDDIIISRDNQIEPSITVELTKSRLSAGFVYFVFVFSVLAYLYNKSCVMNPSHEGFNYILFCFYLFVFIALFDSYINRLGTSLSISDNKVYIKKAFIYSREYPITEINKCVVHKNCKLQRGKNISSCTYYNNIELFFPSFRISFEDNVYSDCDKLVEYLERLDKVEYVEKSKK